jgi:hypothetical protein
MREAGYSGTLSDSLSRPARSGSSNSLICDISTLISLLNALFGSDFRHSSSILTVNLKQSIV